MPKKERKKVKSHHHIPLTTQFKRTSKMANHKHHTVQCSAVQCTNRHVNSTFYPRKPSPSPQIPFPIANIIESTIPESLQCKSYIP